jgi:hypothetical protein
MQLPLSYLAATCAMLFAALYLALRLRMFVTTCTMLIGFLLLIYGPAFLSYTLTSGEPYFLFNRLSGIVGAPHPIFAIIAARGPSIDAIVVAMNFSIALMYLGIIAGMEAVNWMAPRRAVAAHAAISDWNAQPLRDDGVHSGLLLATIAALALFMFYVSISESHLTTIEKFFSIKGDNDARNAFRAQFSSSPLYAYRLVLSAIAPMFVAWGALAGLLRRSWPLLLAAGLLFVATMIGKIETLSKAPPVFFLVQLAVAALLVYSNRLSWKLSLLAGVALFLIIYAATRLIMIFPQGDSPLPAVYARIFEAESQSLLENFAVFPALHSFMSGTNLRPIAMLMGQPYEPAFSIVAYTWHGTRDATSPSLFIADAWADFAYVGVLGFSILAGAICRGIDLTVLAGGKTVLAIAVLCATFIGVFTLITTALNIALFTGGLLLAPLLAAMLMAITRYVSRDARAS